MFCTHCGTKIESGLSKCPNCGEKLPEQTIKSRAPYWLKTLFAIGILGFVVALLLLLNKSDPASVVEDQLKALGKNQLTEAYYGSTSPDFQQVTSLESFKEIIHSFPLLTKVTNYEVKDLKEEGNNATLNMLLTTNTSESFQMEYLLVKDEGHWKISGFKSLSLPKKIVSESQVKEGAVNEVIKKEEPIIRQRIQDFIALIKAGNFKKAYEESTSPEFKKETTFEAFKTVLEEYSFFVNNDSIDLKYDSSTPPVESYKADLVSDNGLVGQTQFDMILINKDWKIEQILIFQATEEPSSQVSTSTLEFEEALVSDEASDKGLISDAKDPVKDIKGPLYVNLIMLNTTQGEVISLTLSNPKLKIQSPPIEHVVEFTAKRYVAFFKFDMPRAGWPKGEYILEAQNDSSETAPKTFDFQVE